MSKIIVQKFEYLKGAMEIGGGVNPFYGSANIKNNTNITDDHFHYCVKITKKDEDFVIRAEYTLSCKALSAVEEDKIIFRDFDFSEDGRLEAIKWLESEYEKANQ